MTKTLVESENHPGVDVRLLETERLFRIMLHDRLKSVSKSRLFPSEDTGYGTILRHRMTGSRDRALNVVFLA